MATPEKANPLTPSDRAKFPKINIFFDAALYIVRRSKELAWEAKELIVALLILLLLIQHAIHVLLSG